MPTRRAGAVRGRWVELRQLIRTRWNIAYPERTRATLLRRLGFPHIAARPRNLGQEPARIEEFKKRCRACRQGDRDYAGDDADRTALLPERPAFLVTAGQRGGGKTTLVNMITLAALGHRAAAAGWSDNAKERKKALFAYPRQGMACVAWDNITRGAAISCSHVEAALTAAEISHRVLGVSRVETVPSTTVQIFTGNSITPRGDMTSWPLIFALNVNRPDPEDRPFVDADPLVWTQANRLTIVRALYTLLIAGALARPRKQEAKTRFKTWGCLVG